MSDSGCSPDFFEDLLPSVEQMALLYHLSFLRVGGFPKLQCLITEEILETRILFVSSEALLQKCVGRSSHLVSSLLPKMIKAVDENSVQVVQCLVEIKTWIDDTRKAVDDMVKRYEQQLKSVAICTSEVILETRDLHQKLDDSKIKLDIIPSPDHLNEVQQDLTTIQKILIHLEKFWEGVSLMLESLKDEIFGVEGLIEDLDDLKEEFLTSIEKAINFWQKFGGFCQRAQSIFIFQSKDPFQFWRTNPSSLSEEERKTQYESIMEKLKRLNPQASF